MAKAIPAYVHELLRDIRELTGRQFVYEDYWCGMVPFDGKLTELQTGPPVPFAELTWREQADVLRSFIHWNRYPEAAWNDEYRIRDNIAAGKRPEQWLEGTSFLDPALHAERREQLIQETFELSREIGYAHFLADNFDRPDPELVRLNPQEREAFLREWWDAARERMYAGFREQMAGISDEVLARNKQAYQEVLTELRDKLPVLLGDESASHRLEAAASPGKEQTPSPATVHFRGFTCELDWKTYPDGRPALYLVDADTRETVAVATADLPYVPLKPGEVFIKDHSENRGMLAALEKAGIVQATGETVGSGFVEVPVAKVLSPIQRRDRQNDRDNARANESVVEKEPANQRPVTRDTFQQMLQEASQRTVPAKDQDKDQGIER